MKIPTSARTGRFTRFKRIDSDPPAATHSHISSVGRWGEVVAGFSSWVWQNGRKNGRTGGRCHKGITTTTSATYKIRGSYEGGAGHGERNSDQKGRDGILYRVHGTSTATHSLLQSCCKITLSQNGGWSPSHHRHRHQYQLRCKSIQHAAHDRTWLSKWRI